jgi:DeoR/GlpR family transcriptional regulator of sugar metabolism
MKRSRAEVAARREALAELLREKGYLPVRELVRLMNVSEATLRRDLSALEKDNHITRTHGGALVDYNLRFPSFQQRLEVNRDHKRAIARQAVDMIQPDTRLYLDAGTTIYEIALLIKNSQRMPLEIVTPNLPVAEVMAGVEGLRVFLTGGCLLERQSILIGPLSEVGIRSLHFDLALMSAEGFDDKGLWNSTEEVVRQQKVVLKQSSKVVFCIDPSKHAQQAEVFLGAWKPEYILNSGNAFRENNST